MRKSSSIFYLVSSIVSGISGFILISMLTKNFLPEEYGYYSLIITTVSLATTVLIGWISQSLIRFYEEFANKQKGNYVINTIIFTTIIVNIIILLIIMLVVFFTKGSGIGDYIRNFLIVSFLFFVSESFYLILGTILRAKNNSKLYSISVILYTVFKLIITIVYIMQHGKNISSIIYYYSMSGAIVSILIFLTQIKNIRINIKYFSTTILVDFFKYGIPLIGLSAMQWIMASSDRYIIGAFRNSKEVGIYSLSYSLANNIFSILTTFLLLSAYPKIISSMNKHGKAGAAKSISDQQRYYFLIIIPLFAGITALSKDLILYISSPEYLEGQMTLIISALGMVIYGITFYYNKTWELSKDTKKIFLHALYSGIINILLNIILVPRYGYESAAYTTLFAYIIYLFITVYRSNKEMKIPLKIRSIFKIVLCSLVMYISVYVYCENVNMNIFHLIISAIIGSVIYAALLAILGEISNEIKVIKSSINKLIYKSNRYSK
ncbi:polysaccharide biosynthesis C-terminal domain-containing protein [Priestia megaterium]